MIVDLTLFEDTLVCISSSSSLLNACARCMRGVVHEADAGDDSADFAESALLLHQVLGAGSFSIVWVSLLHARARSLRLFCKVCTLSAESWFVCEWLHTQLTVGLWF
mgnify:CR=1 FL=1